MHWADYVVNTDVHSECAHHYKMVYPLYSALFMVSMGRCQTQPYCLLLLLLLVVLSIIKTIIIIDNNNRDTEKNKSTQIRD